MNGIGSSASGSGNNLTLHIALTFKPAFAGQKTIFMSAKSSGGLESGYQQRGSWTVPTSCSYSIAPATASAPAAGATGSVTVTALAGCPWTGASNVAWIAITSGTITSAASIMVVVFAVFVTLKFVFIQQLGLGLAVAVFIDATLIRSVLLPASMTLLGDWNWWMPRFLGWIPRVTIEGEPDDGAPATA